MNTNKLRLLTGGLALLGLIVTTTPSQAFSISSLVPVRASVWFYDGDHDGQGDPFHKMTSLLWPGEPWVSNDDDCNDFTPLPCPPEL